mgnify:CR=1 FL=1|jgi:holo-[acyl-carrier protein] synthase
MIVGLGIDIVHVNRMRHWLENPSLMERFFHPAEIEAVRQRGDTAALTLAARFAAKEAFGKALGTGLAGMKLRDIQVVNNHNGKPDMLLFGDALASLHRVGGRHVHLSLTHERENAVAVVVIED